MQSIWNIFIIIFTFPISTIAAPIVPRFTSGVMESSSVSKSIIVERILTHNLKTGFSYSVQGHNIKTKNDVPISPDAQFTNHQTVDGVSFSWVSPKLEQKPQWEIVNEGQQFSILENFTAPGLDATSLVERTIESEVRQEVLSVFSQ
tara:strand:+ start:85 stop:525 length:441 start_codon:yes stop_codon:yes gene_type:complete